MADRINLEVNHITAGKFVPVGNQDLSLKQKIRAIGQTVSSNSDSIKISILEGLANDNVLSPEEKIVLRQELDYIITGYAMIEKNVKEIGLENSKEFQDYKKVYEELLATIEPVLEDMTTSSNVDSNFLDIFRKYSSYANVLNNYLIAYQAGLQSNLMKYSLVVKPSLKTIGPGETANITAYIYKGDADITELEMNKLEESSPSNPYPTLFDWKIQGTIDDAGFETKYKGKREFPISFSDIKGTHFVVSFSSQIDV